MGKAIICSPQKDIVVYFNITSKHTKRVSV